MTQIEIHEIGTTVKILTGKLAGQTATITERSELGTQVQVRTESGRVRTLAGKNVKAI